MGGIKFNLPIDEIKSEYESGMTLAELAEKYEVSINTIRKRLIEAGVQTRRYTRSIKKQKRKEIIAEMYHQQGMSLRGVSDELGISRERIRQILNEVGVGTRGLSSKTELNDTELEELKDMLKEGLSIEQVKKHFAITIKTLRLLMKREGLKKHYVPRVSWDYKKAEEEYLSGVPLKEIARRHGVKSYGSVKKVMDKLGHEPRGKYLKLPIEQIKSDYESGMSISQLKRKYDVSQPTIRDRLIGAGVQIRNGGVDVPVDEIKSEYQSDMSQRELAEKYGVSRETIRNRLREAGVQTRKRGGNKIELPVEQIKSECESGMTQRELVVKYGVSRDTIRNRLIEAGVQTRNGGGFNKIELPMEQIKSEYESGMTQRELGKKYGVASNTIRNRLLKEGVQTRKRGVNEIELPMEQIKSDYESGMTQREVGEKYGVSKGTIRNRLIEAGV